MPDRKISELDSTTSVKTGAMFPLSQTEGENLKTVKGTVEQIGDYIAKMQDHSTLNTVSKKIIGAINEILASGIGTIEGTASGAIASFNDGGDNIPVNSLVAEITAVQAGEGTPSPSNVRAISGFDSVVISRSGKNLFNPNLIQFGTYSNGVWNLTTVSGDSGKVAYKDFFKENTRYTFSGHEVQSDTDRNVRLRIYYTDGTTQNLFTDITTSGKNFSVTSLADKTIETVNIIYSGQGTVEITNFQIELGTTATTYDSYKGTTHTIALGSTVYGGTLDVTKGILTVTHGFISDLSDNDWTLFDADNHIFRMPLSDIKSPSTNDDRNKGIICSCYKPSDGVLVNNQMDNEGMLHLPYLLYIRDTAYSDATTFKSSLSGQQFAYELATPVVIQLTPTEVVTLLGENNIYANSGDVEVEYFTNKANEIAELIEAEIASLSTDFHVYSTNEKVVGRWIDGKPIYEKTINCGSLPNNSRNNFASLTNVDLLIYMNGFAYSTGNSRPLPFSAGGTNDIRLDYENGDVEIVTFSDWSSYTGYVIVRYTKTTD